MSQASIDTSDMVAVHRVFRNELGSAQAVVATAGRDAERRAMLANYYSNLLAFLEAHHEGEEELLFPLLEERTPEESAAVRRAVDEHHQVLGLLEGAKDTVGRWGQTGEAADSATVQSIDALCSALIPHLDEEERAICPMAAVNVTPEEWGRLPGHAMGAFSGDKIWLILGLVLEQLSPEQRQHAFANMPPPAVEMWSGFGEAAFIELIGQVRQDS